jgi:serine/threonine-protein kinase
MDLQAGTVFAGYTIVRQLGTGGMGSVYLVRHPRLPRQDAMKVIHSHLSANPMFVARFEREAEIACTLDHPSLVKVYDRGMDEDRLWITMQYIQGLDADELVSREGRLDPDRAVRIVGAIAEALDHAHAAGLVHRDVKPANILLTQGGTGGERAYLTDFGIAHVDDVSRQLTATGDLLASLPYAAPEQLAARPVTGAVDVHGLGCVLYELITGRRMFAQQTAPALMGAVLSGPGPDVWKALPPGHPALQDVIARGVAQDPAERFPTCTALAEAAREAVAPATATVAPPREAEPARPLVPTGPASGASISPPPPSGPVTPPPWSPTGAPPWSPPDPVPWQPSAPAPNVPAARSDGFGGFGGFPSNGGYPSPVPPLQPAARSGLPPWLLWLVPAIAVVVAVGVVAAVLLTRGLGAPGSVRAEAQPEGVALRWDAVGGAVEYEVRRDGAAVGRTSETSYVDTEVGSGARVTYTVVTVGRGSERSDQSDPSTVVSALHPADVTATIDGDAVTLAWSPVENAERYEVRRGEDVVAADLTQAQFLDEGLEAGTHDYTVLAFDDDGGAPSSSASTQAQVSPWLDADDVAAAFADLLPDVPGPGGWGDSTCGVGELLDSSVASAAIFCNHPSGIYVEFSQYPDQAALDERIAFLDTVADPASYPTTSRGGWYRQSTGDASPAWEAWGFTEPDRQLMEIYIQWDGHTIAELDSTWFYAAPW